MFQSGPLSLVFVPGYTGLVTLVGHCMRDVLILVLAFWYEALSIEALSIDVLKCALDDTEAIHCFLGCLCTLDTWFVIVCDVYTQVFFL